MVMSWSSCCTGVGEGRGGKRGGRRNSFWLQMLHFQLTVAVGEVAGRG